MRRGYLLVSACVAIVVLLAGCGGDGAGGAGSPSVAAPSASGAPSGPGEDRTDSQPGATSTASPTPSASVLSSSPSNTVDPTSSPSGCVVPGKYAGADLERLPITGKKIALTFDAGASAAGVPPILRTLARKHVPATFFLTGDFVRAYPGRSAKIGVRHLVGNHTDSHPDLTELPADEVEAELQLAQAAILQVTGQDPRRFFRFPFGARDARTIDIVNQHCYVAFRWTVDTLGWKGTSGGVTVATVVQRVLDAAGPGSIVLMHVGANPEDGSTLDADALPTVIRKLRTRGYRFVDLSAALAPGP